ncbi:hypothetical protein NPIL_542921 [Nephila pilipes]|uniref:Uncharacterized protein n=1 Tax=Nephila pilipes TaxID=299642 RepID=A0A8X6MZI7_NEPPI|nr:hypothetical protein NPIL_542921 [Nephila pilipes]
MKKTRSTYKPKMILKIKRFSQERIKLEVEYKKARKLNEYYQVLQLQTYQEQSPDTQEIEENYFHYGDSHSYIDNNYLNHLPPDPYYSGNPLPPPRYCAKEVKASEKNGFKSQKKTAKQLRKDSQFQIPITNPFSGLTVTPNQNDDSPSTSQKPIEEKISPIVMRTPKNYSEILKGISKVAPNTKSALAGNYIKLYPNGSDTHISSQRKRSRFLHNPTSI